MFKYICMRMHVQARTCTQPCRDESRIFDFQKGRSEYIEVSRFLKNIYAYIHLYIPVVHACVCVCVCVCVFDCA